MSQESPATKQYVFLKQLAQENDWQSCYVEATRASIADPKDIEIQYYKAISEIKICRNKKAALNNLYTIYTSTNRPTSDKIRILSAYEYGREKWKTEKPEEAFNALTFTFYNTSNPELFILSGFSLFQFAQDYPKYKKEHPSLYMQINSSRDLWNAKYLNRTKIDSHRKDGLITKAGKGFISFYRTQIGPAIGERCVLQPSCSEYFKRNINKHGIVAVPMQADRFCREPDESHKSDNIVIINDKIKHTDPITNHDFWFEQQ
jgi:putative component of membrane protein insertase Oxa1/YidC/SpoIIIJ protein YidD